MPTTTTHTQHWDVHRTLMLVSYSLVLAAFLPIGLSGEVGQVAPAAFVVAMVISLFRDPRTSPPRPQTALLWTGVVLAAFAAGVFWSLQDGNWLLHALEFALLLTVSRFFQRRFAKDHLQLIALSFILLLVAAILQPGPLFAFCFLGYAILTMWALTVLHLVREIEIQTHTGPEHLLPPEPPKRRWLGLLPPKPLPPQVKWPELPIHASTIDWRSRRLVGPRFFFATSVLSLAVLSGSALFFFLFPRIGVGFFIAQTRPAKSVIGFSTEAELGHFGALKNNAEVVMRVTFPDDPQRLQQSMRMRGATYDRFEGSRWTRADEAPAYVRGNFGQIRLPRTDAPDPSRDVAYKAEIYLEPLANKERVLFTPPGAWSVELLDTRFDYLRGRHKRILRTSAGDLTFQAPPDTALHYAVQVAQPRDDTAEAERLRQATGQVPADLLKRYTDLPADLDPRIAPLARQLAGPATSWFDQAQAIEKGLHAGWTYSLAGDQDAEKPLQDFLFGKKRGHCEYFATAMTLMLRSLGVPAREVHGFAGGVFNPIGNYRMIRQGDAHAWVEVYFPRIGWRTFDPTPPSGQIAEPEDGISQQIRQLVDGANLVWYQWVVEYDLERQAEVLKAIGEQLKKLGGGAKMNRLLAGGSQRQVVEVENDKQSVMLPPWVLPTAVILGCVAAAIPWWRRRQAQRAAGFDPDVDRATARLQRGLGRRGWQRQPHETWHGTATRVADLAPTVGQALSDFAALHDRARFGAQGPVAVRAALTAAGDRVLHALDELPRQGRS